MHSKYFLCIIDEEEKLRRYFEVLLGDEEMEIYADQIVIRNWNDILPDVDILLVEKETNAVRAIISCKTSLRERLTETAFWKREIEKIGNKKLKLIFITTDKDNELKIDTNRYILLHVIDCTFVTNPRKYEQLLATYQERYGDRKDFYKLFEKSNLLRK